ncbi:MAG: 16S rRNA (cytidine(1402)-2'-O)-methyltransferase [Syntrophales bacterium]|jgi:16S rRNA (cytidine1402-2'-O)-methyltransferase|nr:16S rRNA (cytidine(1402)-2'-O)-methyltransferase [Syntrophales bacterium]MDY0044563.1 16S rRNA (cytidine(1402)-2'-O)-methyltransferase [Syntrophales bacterium]
MKKGTLYIVATPIGNLEDITLRALRILKEVALIAAEDTRRTGRLLSAHGISTPQTSFHDHNEHEKSSFVLSKLEEGMDVAYVSDAGTPGISDPGYLLVRESVVRCIPVVSVPGPSAAIAALSISGLPMDSFCFYAFLPSRPAKRRQLLETLKNEEKTLIFYESPKRIARTLEDIRTIFGERSVALSRELTKIHEETLRGPVSKILDALKEKKAVKGEITLIIEGTRGHTPNNQGPEDLWHRFQTIQKTVNLSTRDAVSIVAAQTGLSRKKVYETILGFLKK